MFGFGNVLDCEPEFVLEPEPERVPVPAMFL